ncbi:MAG: hypothetical protein IPI49_11160 [Myxococcales bacterium]|nr:hypothetical protein [Myxococcales bacterium]
MSTLSEVTILVGQRARDIEKAREIFVAEIRAFVGGILSGIRIIRGEPWTAPRVRIVLPKEIENETKTTSDLSSHYGIARTELRFKKGTNFRQISDVRFGIEFDETSERFVWHVTLVPAAAEVAHGLTEARIGPQRVERGQAAPGRQGLAGQPM